MTKEQKLYERLKELRPFFVEYIDVREKWLKLKFDISKCKQRKDLGGVEVEFTKSKKH